MDDKIIKRASEQGRTIGQITDPIVTIFHDDLAWLRIERAEHYPRATGHIPRMIELMRRSEEKGAPTRELDVSLPRRATGELADRQPGLRQRGGGLRTRGGER